MRPVGATVGQPAGEREHLQDGHARFDGVAARALDLPGDEHRLRLRHVDGVAVLQRDVQRHVAGLQLVEVDAEDLRFAAASPFDPRVFGGARTIVTSRPAVGRDRAGLGERREQRHVAGELILTRLFDLPHDHDPLALVGFDRDADLRVLEDNRRRRVSSSAPASSSRSVSPRAVTRPISGNVNVPSCSIVYLRDRSVSPRTVTMTTSCGPST